MALTDFLRKTKKRIFDGITIDAGAGIQKGFSSLGRMARGIRNEIADSPVGDYFRPTERVRTRDFVREVPGSVTSVGKTMFGGTLNVAKNVPKILGEGSAYALDKNVREQYKKGNTEILPTITKVTPTKMLGDTGKSLLEVGTLGRGPKLGVMKNPLARTGIGTAGGYAYDVADRASEKGKLEKKDFTPGMNTLASGVLSAVSRPGAELVREGIKDAKVAVEDIKRFPRTARTTIIPAAKEKISRELHDVNKHMGTFRPGKDGKLEKVDGFNLQHKQGEFNYPEEKIVEPWNPKSGLINGILKPGFRIEDVRKNPELARKLSEKIAEKNSKAKGLVEDQINRLKNGVQEAADGFVMPEKIKGKVSEVKEGVKTAAKDIVERTRAAADPEADFLKSLENTPAPFETAKKGFNRFQEAAFNAKQERIKALKEVVEAPTILRAMGFNKRQAERIGADDQKVLARLGQLGYRKGDPILEDVRSDMVKRILENQVTQQTLREYYNRKRSLNTNFLEGIDPSTLKDIPARRAGWSDVYRNTRDVFGNNFEKIKRELLDPLDESKGNFIDERDGLLRDLEDNIVKKFGIQKGSRESAAIQRYGDPELPDGEKMSYDDLLQEFGKQKADQIVAADAWFRQSYSRMIDELNAVREFYFPTHPLYPESTKVIPKKENYYRHFREMANGVKALMEILKNQANIDPALAVSSQWTKPLTKWLSFAQQRKGKRTDIDAVGGFIDYINAAMYSKHIDPHIQRFRGVDSELAAEARKSRKFFDESQIGLAEELSKKINPISEIAMLKDAKDIAKLLVEKGLQKRDALRMSKDLAGKNTIEEVSQYLEANLTPEGIGKFAPHAAAEESENKLNNFLKFLDSYANNLAGKTNPLDRPFQDNFISRQGFAVVNWLNSRVKANTIVGSAGSSLAQFFGIPLGAAEAGPKNSLKSVGRTLLDVFDTNSPSAQSPFLRERFSRGADRFDPGVLARTRDFAVWLTSIGDKVGSTFTWNANYLKALERRIPNPAKYADDITRDIVGGRGIGEMPIMQQSKVIQLAMPFQYEVGNLWAVFRQWAKNDPRKLELASKLVQYSVYAWMMNRVVKEIRGSDVTFDPIEATMDAINAYQEADSTGEGILRASGRLAGEVLSNIPGGAIPASWYPEYGKKDILGTGVDLPTREDLFGDKDPTRFGGGLLASKSLQDPLFMALPPFGGRQIRSTIQGASDLLRGYTESASGRVMTPVDASPYNIAKGLLFGTNALQEVQDYRAADQQPLSEDQSEKFRLGIPGYYEGVMASRAADNEKETILKGLSKGQAVERAENLPENVYQLKDGAFWVPTLRADTKTFDTAEDATFAIQKEEFEDSTDSFRDLGEYVLRKREDGSVYPQRKDAFTVSLLTAKMTGAKRSEDYEKWTESANQQYQLLQKLIQDPTVDELERAEYENKMMLLEDDFSKYESYGGNFKKGSAGKKLPEQFRYPLVDADLIRVENSIASPSRASLSVGVPMRFVKPRMVKSRKVKSRKVNL